MGATRQNYAYPSRDSENVLDRQLRPTDRQVIYRTERIVFPDIDVRLNRQREIGCRAEANADASGEHLLILIAKSGQVEIDDSETELPEQFPATLAKRYDPDGMNRCCGHVDVQRIHCEGTQVDVSALEREIR